MDKKVKKIWLKALRSGKYKQTRTEKLYNKNSDAYCCLGVLGKVCNFGKHHDFEYLDVDSSRLSLSTQDKLSQLNDRAHYSFKKIADWIEKNL